jgi:hypothetical protein
MASTTTICPMCTGQGMVTKVSTTMDTISSFGLGLSIGVGIVPITKDVVDIVMCDCCNGRGTIVAV